MILGVLQKTETVPGKFVYYPGAPHGVTATHQEKVNADLLAFLLG